MTEETKAMQHAMLAAMACAFDTRATYVSAPITTGARFHQWAREAGHRLDRDSDQYERAHRAEVIERNVAVAADVVRRARQAYGCVIDPTALEMPGWSQPEYHQFWTRVLCELSERVVLAPGWEASVGCVLEFTAARVGRFELRDADLVVLDDDRARSLLKAALDETAHDRLRAVVQEALAAVDQGGSPC